MKEVLVDLAAYHRWANERLLNTVLKLPPDVTRQAVASSFPSLFETFQHVLWTEQVWILRLQMKENPDYLADEPVSTFDQLAKNILSHNARVVEWVQEQKEVFLMHPVAYYNTKKQYFKTPVYQCLLHLFNHGTYHRGQVVTMLRELGITKIPATDYIAFVRKEK